jgi:hypothetical protein
MHGHTIGAKRMRKTKEEWRDCSIINKLTDEGTTGPEHPFIPSSVLAALHGYCGRAVSIALPWDR